MMEGAGQERRPRKRKGPVGCLLLLMCMFSPAVTLLQEEKKCPIGDFLTEEGICCNKCSAGLKLVEKCHTAGQRSNCTACPEGEYTDEMNYSPNCRRCTHCRRAKHELELSPCERHRNTVCECEDGYYKFKIDSVTNECRKCRQCGADEHEEKKCTKDSNTKCGCKPNYYRVLGKCEPCSVCSDECQHFCPETTKGSETHNNILINVIAGAVTVCVVLLGLVAFITYVVTKFSTKKKLLSNQTSVDSKSSCKEVLITEPSENSSVDAIPERPVSDQEPSNLPDCVPKEIKIPELIYTVLNLVPVRQVKQLVRSLGVSDTEIEQAEADHRSCREAHYQMLRVWAETCSRSGGGGRGKMLHWPLLQELLDKLRMMHLEWAVQQLEAKYGIQ